MPCLDPPKIPISIHMIEQLLESRSTTRAWTSREPSVDDINTILRCIAKTPFKQNTVDVRVVVLGPETADRKDRYCRESRGITGESHIASRDAQTQLLAPYVFYIHTVDRGTNVTEQGISLGIVAQTIVLTAQSLGLASGFCACLPDVMSKELGVQPCDDLAVSVGYARTDVDSRERRQIDSSVLMAVHDDPPRPNTTEWIDVGLAQDLALPNTWDRSPDRPSGPTDDSDGVYRWINPRD